MYQMISGTYRLDGRSYTSYGIQCGDTRIEDVTTNRPALAAFLAQCNHGALAPCHLADELEDFFARPAPITGYAVPVEDGLPRAI